GMRSRPRPELPAGLRGEVAGQVRALPEEGPVDGPGTEEGAEALQPLPAHLQQVAGAFSIVATRRARETAPGFFLLRAASADRRPAPAGGTRPSRAPGAAGRGRASAPRPRRATRDAPRTVRGRASGARTGCRSADRRGSRGCGSAHGRAAPG